MERMPLKKRIAVLLLALILSVGCLLSLRWVQEGHLSAYSLISAGFVALGFVLTTLLLSWRAKVRRGRGKGRPYVFGREFRKLLAVMSVVLLLYAGVMWLTDASKALVSVCVAAAWMVVGLFFYWLFNRKRREVS